jgi:hypothetical protein
MYYEAVQAGKDVAGEEFDAQMAKIRDLQESIREMRRNQNVADV